MIRQSTKVLAVSLAFGAYFIVRYSGLWAEWDSQVFVTAISRMQQEGGLDYPGSYRHGYGYPVWATILSTLTGLGVTDMTQLYLPLLSNALLGVFGFAAFRRLLGSERLGVLAAVVLFLVPEVVFTVSRGNHEKLTVSLTLLALLALVGSFLEMARTRRWRVFAAWAFTYYLTAFTLVSLNALFGSSFIVASTFAWVFALFALRLRRNAAPALVPVVRRLLIVTAVSWSLVALVMFFVYPPAGNILQVMETTGERFSALFLSFTPEGEDYEVADPYIVTSSDWGSQWGYQLVSSFRWLLFASSFLAWGVLVVPAIRRVGDTALERLFLVALYGAFGLQLALAVPVDFLGLAAGTNLQVRIYTYFALLAAPLFAVGVYYVVEFPALAHWRGTLRGIVAVSLAGFAALSLLKATLDPVVSNRFLPYSTAEVAAVHFWDVHHSHQHLWVGADGRLRSAYPMTFIARPAHSNILVVQPDDVRHGHAIRSDLVREAAIARRIPLPTHWLDNLAYDNGGAQLFHRVPRTAFQR